MNRYKFISTSHYR